MKAHPACLLFPEMQPDDFAALVADIKAHGVRVPVLVWHGEIIDGRHRWRACKELGIECPTQSWAPRHGESLVEYVVSLNLHRRVLTASQRAMVARDMLPLLEAEAAAKERGGRPAGKQPSGPPPPRKPQSRDVAAKAAGVSPRYVQDAKAIGEKSPKLAADIKSGKVSIPEAKKQLRTPPPPPRKKQTPADLALAAGTADLFRGLINDANRLRRAIEDLAASPVGRELRMQDINREMKNVASWIKAAIPFKKCPFRGCTKTCKACHGTGWVNEQVWDNIPKDAKS